MNFYPGSGLAEPVGQARETAHKHPHDEHKEQLGCYRCGVQEKIDRAYRHRRTSNPFGSLIAVSF
jgi:hypothetical protein